MEKYGTYKLLKNTVTGECIRFPINADPPLIKEAEKSQWKELYIDMEVNPEEDPWNTEGAYNE